MNNPQLLVNIHTSITLLAQITDQIQTAITELQNSQPGFPTNTSGTGAAPTLTQAGTPAGLERYLNSKDAARTDLTQLKHAAQMSVTNAAAIHRIVTTWANPAHPPTHTPNNQCLTCDHYTTAKGNDRLRSGLCQACHRSWTRARATTDRATWMLQRRQHNTGDMVTT